MARQRRGHGHPHRAVNRIDRIDRGHRNRHRPALPSTRSARCRSTPIQKANSGVPALPMALAPFAYTLWQRRLRFDPRRPISPNRDRFVLSAGHASMCSTRCSSSLACAPSNRTTRHVGEPAVTSTTSNGSASSTTKAPGHPEYHCDLGVGHDRAAGPGGRRPRSGWRSPPVAGGPLPPRSTSTCTRSAATAPDGGRLREAASLAATRSSTTSARSTTTTTSRSMAGPTSPMRTTSPCASRATGGHPPGRDA